MQTSDRPLWLLIAIYLLTGANGLASEAPQREVSLVPQCGGLFYLCGYEDRSGRGEHIDKQYEVAKPFSEGLAVVRINGQYGYIDTTGKVVIPPIYEGAGPFQNGIAEVALHGKAGIISREGKMLLTPQFDRAIPFTAEVVLAQPDTPKLTPSGALRSDHLLQSFNGPSGLYHLEQGWLTPAKYTFQFFGGKSANFISAREHAHTHAPFGLMRADGTWQLPAGFDHVQRLSDGLAVVSVTVEKRRVWGAVSAKGELAIPPKYDHLSYWSGGYAVVKIGEEEGFLKPDDTLFGRRLYQKVARDKHGHALAVQSNDTWYRINSDGQLQPVLGTPQSPAKTPRIARSHANVPSVETGHCSGGAYFITQNGLWGLKGPDGGTLVAPEHQAISCFHQGVARVPDMSKRLWCAIGPDGRPRKRPECVPL